MDEFYGIPPQEIERLHAAARSRFGMHWLTEALRRLKDHAGSDAVEEFREGTIRELESETDDAPEFDRIKKLAIEDVYRAAQEAMGGVPRSSSRGSGAKM